MAEPLDVLLRVRMRYEAEGTARKAVGDLDQVRAAGTKLGAVSVGDRLGRELREVSERTQGAKRELADFSRVSARFGAVSTVHHLGRDLRALASPAQTARREMVALGTAAQRLGDSHGPRALERELDRAGRKADDVRRRVGAIGGGSAAPGTGLRAHRHEFANEALTAAGLGGPLRFGMAGAGVAGVAAGAAVAAVGAGIAGATGHAIRFESAMAEVKKAVDDLSPEKFAEMERTILRTSRTTGVAKEEMAKLVAQAGFAGRPTQELARFAEFGAKAAGAFGMTPEETGEKLAKLGNIYKANQEGIEDLANGINVLGDNTAARERQVIDFLTRTGAMGKDLGLTAFQTGAIGAAMVSAGQQTEVAATGFNALAQKLANAKDQSKDFQAGLRALGTNARRLKADLSQDAFEAYLKVLEKLNTLPQSKKLEVASRIGGLEHGDELLAQAGAIDQIRAAYAKVQDQAARAGSVEKAFKIFDATTQRSIDRAGASMEAFATKIGQRFNPAISAAARYVERLFGGMTKAIERGERAEALARKLAKGGTLSPKEQAEVDANPRLKRALPQEEAWQRRMLEFERNRERSIKAPGTAPSQDQAREAWQKKAQEWEERRQRALNPATPPVDGVPGTGKRSELSDGARVSLAAYHDEVDHSLARTERLVRDVSRRMREDLAIKARFDLAVDRFGSTGGGRIETAAYSSVPLGGAGGGFGSGGGGGESGVSLSPGRFGIPVPGGRGAGSRRGGGGRMPSARDRARFGTSGGGGGGADTPRGSGAGTRGSARTGPMMAYAMDQLRREGVPEGKLRESAAHLVGQAHMESGLDPNKSHDGGTGYGIYGARDPSPGRGRRTDMFNWLEKNGYAKNSAEGQMRYMAHEAMSGRYRQTRRILMGEGSGNLDSDTNTITREFESPAIVNRRSGAVRNALQAGPESEASREAGRPGEASGTGPGPDGIPNLSDKVRHRFGQRTGTDGFIFHHTAGRGSVDGVINTFNQRGFPAHYVMDRDGQVTQTLPDGAKGAHMLNASKFAGAQDKSLSNANTMGMEVIAKDDRDVTPAQVEAAKRFSQQLREKYPGIKFFGHGEENPGHKQTTEGLTIANAVRRMGSTAAAPFKPGDMPAGWARRVGAEDGGGQISPRFSDPSRMRLSPAAGAEGGGAAGGGAGAAGGPSVIQNFHGGFDASETARRAKLEQNREIRRTQARSLHSIGRVA